MTLSYRIIQHIYNWYVNSKLHRIYKSIFCNHFANKLTSAIRMYNLILLITVCMRVMAWKKAYLITLISHTDISRIWNNDLMLISIIESTIQDILCEWLVHMAFNSTTLYLSINRTESMLSKYSTNARPRNNITILFKFCFYLSDNIHFTVFIKDLYYEIC